MNVLLAALFMSVSTNPALAQSNENLCTVSYLQNKIEVSKSDFTSEKMIAAEHSDLLVDQRRVGFDESFDAEIAEKLKSKGYELTSDLKGHIELRKFEVTLTEETFKEHLFIQFALRTSLPGIENFEQQSSIGMIEQLSQKKQAHDVVTFLDQVPSCDDLKKAATIAETEKAKKEADAKNKKESEINQIKDSFGGYDGLETLFTSLTIERETVGYLGHWKAFLKAHKDDTSNESTFDSIAFDGEPNFHLDAEQVEKNKAVVDIGCPGGYVDLEFKEGEIKFSHWNCSNHWSYYHCKYYDKDDSMICNLRDENSNHSYVIYHRYDPFK